MVSGSSMPLFAKSEEEDQINQAQPQVVPSRKRRRNCLDPSAEVIALSPTTLMAENRFVCEVCSKGFPREQNLEIHKRGHNLPWKLKQKSGRDQDEVKKKVYLCPVTSCVNHDPSYALGDLTGIKKHYSRKHGEKKHKCVKCMKMYAVPSDLKAHLKTCSTKEYRCHCGTLFSRRDSFIKHRAFCEALGVGSEMKHSPTASDMGVGSSKSTANRNNPRQMGVPATHCGSQVSSVQNPTRNALTSTHAVSQFSQISVDSLMNIDSIDLNCYKPSPFFTTLYEQQNKHNNQGNVVDPNFITNLTNNTTTLCNNTETYNISYMGNFKNYKIGKGSNVFSSGSSSVYHPASLYLPRSVTSVMPQLSATALLQKAALIGSKSSNINATDVSRVYTSTSLSDPIGGTTFENERFLVGSKMCNRSESNEHDNMDVLLNSFSNNGNESLVFTQYAGTTYEQDGHGSNDGRYDEHQYSQSIVSNMGFQQSRGMTFTRDFLGVGGAIVGDPSSDEPPRSPLESFLFL